MASEMSKCKLTVLKRTINQDLIDEYLDEGLKDIGPCECFEEGQEIVIDKYYQVPDGFCHMAWSDIRKELLSVGMGGSIPEMRHPGTVLAGCTDWFRPVIFKIERMADE